MQVSFTKLFETYRRNVYPAMLEYIAEKLGVSTESLSMIGIGYEFEGPSWVFPERDENGKIIGLVRRFDNGSKCTVAGSKRGLTYIMNTEHGKDNDRYSPGRHNWTRVSAGMPCPVCGRTKWCMVSSEDLENPPAVICGQQDGSVGESGEGSYLHILDKRGIKKSHCETVLPQTDLPILIVEGQTDVAAAYDLGMVAIGRPSAKSGFRILRKMPLNGRPVAVIGENDPSNAGEEGMESAFQTIKKITNKVVKMLPPDGINDLRRWVTAGLTQDLLIENIGGASSCSNDDVFDDDVAHTVAKDWMEKELLEDGFPNIRLYKGQWLHYNNGRYEVKAESLLRGQLYGFLDGKMYKRTDPVGNVTVEPYKPSRAKVSDIFDALNQWCPITCDPPTWLDDEYHPDPTSLIPFNNGLLNFDDYMEGKVTLIPSTPAYFNMNVLPYDFDPSLESEEWESFLDDIFNGKQDMIDLMSEWFGYNCVPDMSHEKMMIFTGRPRSGKSTVLEAMRHMLGYSQCCETSFQSLCGTFGLQHMEGKLAALIGDAKTPNASQSDSALEKILQIVGGDPVTINRKGITQLPIVNLKCRFTMAMNELPAFADHANALSPRLNLMQFENSYIGCEDRYLKYRLNKEADSGKLINFALRGLKRLRENGKFTVPESAQALADQFRAISDPVHEFSTECCIFAHDIGEPREHHWITKSTLFDLYRNWCKGNGRAIGMKVRFLNRFLASHPGMLEEINRKTSVGTASTLIGISISDEAKQEYLT
jgi:putative DNA primase/helicase